MADAWGNLRSVRFNQDMTAVVCAFEDGLRVFNIDPIREQAHYKEDQVGSIAPHRDAIQDQPGGHGVRWEKTKICRQYSHDL